MNKGERELLRMLRGNTTVTLERGGSGFVLVRGTDRMNLGSIRDSFDRRQVRKFIEAGRS